MDFVKGIAQAIAQAAELEVSDIEQLLKFLLIQKWVTMLSLASD